MITKREVYKFIKLIRLNFENAYPLKTDEDAQLLVESWYAILKSYPAEVVKRAVYDSMRNAEFAPRIGTIVAYADKIMSIGKASDEELWAMVQKALSYTEKKATMFNATFVDDNGKTQGQNAFDAVQAMFLRMPDELRSYFGNAGEMIRVAREADLSFEKGRFLKSMPVIRERIKTANETPQAVAAAAERKALT